MKILIATPAYGDMVTTTYCYSLMNLLGQFREKHPQIKFEYKILSLSVLSFTRNLFASLVMEDKSFTHLLFVDADMGFGPQLVEHMIALNKPVVGSMAPQRKFDLAAFYALKNEIPDPNVARLVAMDYVNSGSVYFKGGPAKAARHDPPPISSSKEPPSVSRRPAPASC